MEVTNYSPCNFIIQRTNRQHNPPFITWNHIFRTQLNAGRDLSKTKPDVVRRVSSKPNREECVAPHMHSERLCGEQKGWEVEEFIIVMGGHEEWPSREVTHWARRGSLQPGWRAGAAGCVVVCAMCLCVWGCLGVGGEIGQTAGGVIVLLVLSPLSSPLTWPAPCPL